MPHFALMPSLMAGSLVDATPRSRPLTCVYCHQPWPEAEQPAFDVVNFLGKWGADCACGAPQRSALYGADEQGVPYPKTDSGWPR